MRVECPECEAKIHVAGVPDDGTRIKCLKCGHKFKAPEPDVEVDEDEDEEERPAKKAGKKKGKRRDEEAKKFPVVPAVAGGVALLAVAGVALALFLPSKDKAPSTASNSTPTDKPDELKPVAAPPNPNNTPVVTNNNPKKDPRKDPKGDPKDAPKNEPKVTTPTRPPVEVVAGPYAPLFQAKVDAAPPPSVRGANLRPTNVDVEPEIPTFHSLMLARKEAKGGTTSTVVPKTAKLSLEELKKAVAYIKVDAGDQSSTGSGFLITTSGPIGLVATNHHVVDAALKPRYGAQAKVTVVFNSGMPDEQLHKADIVAYDPVADLAILKVESARPWPKPLNPYNTPPKLTEGIPIQFWGFPLGAILAGGNKNPEITLGTGTLAGFQHNTSGKLDQLKISGTMNPGNSGGPIVDGDGRLVGIAVAIVNPAIGTGIGFAVPVNDLIALLEGKMLTTLFIPNGLEAGRAKFIAFAPMMDPLDRIETIFVRRWVGEGKPPEVVKDPFTGFKPFAMRADGKANLPGVEEFPLRKLTLERDDGSSLGLAIGEMTVPLDSAKILIQVASQTSPNPQTGFKYTAASRPVEYTMAVADQPMGTDARPFAELAGNADSMAGSVVVVKARIMAPPVTREPIQDLIVAGLDGRTPDRMKFLVSREMASQFDEVEREQQPMPVRLVCLVGQRGANGILPVRVARIDFISRGDRIVRTIPASPTVDEDLAKLNRDPEKFAGKTVEVTSLAMPITSKFRTSNELVVLFQGLQSPRNLSFTITEAQKVRMVEKLGENLRVNMVIRVRVTGVVPEKPAAANARTVVTVSKIEVMGRDGKVISTVE